MKLLTNKYFAEYKKRFDDKIRRDFEKIKNKLNGNNFEYLIEASAVYSSNIEGNSIDLNSFMNSKAMLKKLKPKELGEILDLKESYIFAKQNDLSEKKFLEAHRIFSKRILIKSKRGKYREEKVAVFDAGGLIYMAIESEYVKPEVEKLFSDIHELLKENLSLEEIFYYASMIHLVMAYIHPFMDGNGRAARILEKWFLSSKLGEGFWHIKSEKYYKENRAEYYTNLNLGPNYYEINYEKCLPFLEMLPKSIIS